MASPAQRAVVLLSGGLDSATAMYIAKRDMGPDGELFALSVAYGQRHAVERQCAERLVQACGAQHFQIAVAMNAWGGSALTDTAIAVPKDRDEKTMAGSIPVTYVPARNSVFLALASSLAESVKARHIYCGLNAVDFSGYPDCRPEFVRLMQATLNAGTKAGVEYTGEDGPWLNIHAPLIHMTKPQIILEGIKLGVPYHMTHSCYDPVETHPGVFQACGSCDSCKIRLTAWEQVGRPDPIVYAGDML